MVIRRSRGKREEGRRLQVVVARMSQVKKEGAGRREGAGQPEGFGSPAEGTGRDNSAFACRFCSKICRDSTGEFVEFGSAPVSSRAGGRERASVCLRGRAALIPNSPSRLTLDDYASAAHPPHHTFSTQTRRPPAARSHAHQREAVHVHHVRQGLCTCGQPEAAHKGRVLP